MKPIKFPESNFEWGVPKGAENTMQPLPCWVEWGVIPLPGGSKKKAPITTVSLWELTDEEVAYIVENKRIWFKQLNGGQPLQPILPIAGPVEFPSELGFCLLYYQQANSLKGVWVWNSTNSPDILTGITLNGEDYYYSDKYEPIFQPNKALDVDDLYFRNATPEEAEKRADESYNTWVTTEYAADSSDDQKIEMYQKLKQNSLKYLLLCKKLQAGKEEVLC